MISRWGGSSKNRIPRDVDVGLLVYENKNTKHSVTFNRIVWWNYFDDNSQTTDSYLLLLMPIHMLLNLSTLFGSMWESINEIQKKWKRKTINRVLGTWKTKTKAMQNSKGKKTFHEHWAHTNYWTYFCIKDLQTHAHNGIFERPMASLPDNGR